MLSSGNAEARIQRLERRINGLKQSISELREENEELRAEIQALQEFEDRAGDQLIDMHERLDDHRDQFRQVKVNENQIKDIKLDLQARVGVSAFESLEERFKQLRSQINLLANAMDMDRKKLQRQAKRQQD